MRTINMKLTGSQQLENIAVSINNNPVTFKQNEFKNLVCNYETDASKINIKIYKMLDVGGIWWFITQLFFFVISIFGIFDVHLKNRYLGLIYEGEIELNDNNDLTINCKTPKENDKAFEIQTDLVVTERSNKYYMDEKTKKISKALLISKIILALAIIAATIIILISVL